jgi:hypothetical protein
MRHARFIPLRLISLTSKMTALDFPLDLLEPEFLAWLWSSRTPHLPLTSGHGPSPPSPPTTGAHPNPAWPSDREPPLRLQREPSERRIRRSSSQCLRHPGSSLLAYARRGVGKPLGGGPRGFDSVLGGADGLVRSGPSSGTLTVFSLQVA